MLHKNDPLVPRGEQDPKFNIKNKTDRKILFTILISIGVLILLVVGFVILYYKFFN